MRILGHIHTFNDTEVIDQSLKALLDQTYPLDEILIVDNGSTDGTLDRKFPDHVAIVRHGENLGTSGAVFTGFQYALDKGYDWIWILDADSAPAKDALSKLLELYRSYELCVQETIRVLASLPIDAMTKEPYHGTKLVDGMYFKVTPNPGERYYECDVTIFSGSLFKLQAVRMIGLPRADYVLDVGECEYAYRGKQHGLRAVVDQTSILYHNIRCKHSLSFVTYRFAGRRFKLIAMSPIRLYYCSRNTLYFWLYEYHGGHVPRFIWHSPWLLRHMVKLLIMSVGHWTQAEACLRGIRDGVGKHMERRY